MKTGRIIQYFAAVSCVSDDGYLWKSRIEKRGGEERGGGMVIERGGEEECDVVVIAELLSSKSKGSHD